MHAPYSAFPQTICLDTAHAIEAAVAAVSRLDARVSASSVKIGWVQRATWSGYARALQLQGGEIDEIDVFSAVHGLTLPARPKRASHTDEFSDLSAWNIRLCRETGPEWRDRLPFTPHLTSGTPAIWSALELLHRYARRDGGIEPWLAFPFFLRGLQFTRSHLPCLVGGTKLFRMRATVTEDMVRTVLRAMTSAANTGLQRLENMERDQRAWLRVLATEFRSTSLVRLAALVSVRPFLSPQSTAEALDLTIGGSGKLLTRAAAHGLLIEISGRRAWRQYLAPELAIAYGFMPAPKGRPPKEDDMPSHNRGLREALDAFDSEMADIDRRLASLSSPRD